MRGDVSQMMFIDSDLKTHGCATMVTLPSTPFSAKNNQTLGLTLCSFTLRRNFYNINPTNGTFYLAVNSTLYRVDCSKGDYTSFTDMRDNIADALDKTISDNALSITFDKATGVTFDQKLRKYTFTFTGVTGTISIVCLHMKKSAPQASARAVTTDNVTSVDIYNDAHQILGGRPSEESVVNAFDVVSSGATVVLESPYPASLDTLDAVYLHILNVETGNYMSTTYDFRTPNDTRLVNSTLFARIGFDESFFSESKEVIRYEDAGGDMYQSLLTNRHLDRLDLRVTDAKGRCLSARSPTQADDGLMNFRMVLRWDLFDPNRGSTKAVMHPLGFDEPLMMTN